MKKILDFIANGTYPGSVLFAYGYNYEKLIQKLKQRCTSKNAYWYQGLEQHEDTIQKSPCCALYTGMEDIKTGHDMNLYYIILQNDFQFKDWDYCMLAHECLHICQFFLPNLLKRDREIEAEAYYHTHLMMNCLELIRKAT